MKETGIPRLLYISVFLLISFVAGGMVYTLKEVRYLTEEHARMLLIPEQVRIHATDAHLKIEELIGGDTRKTREDFQSRMTLAENHTNILATKWHGAHDTFVRGTVDTTGYQEHIAHMRTALHNIREIATQRMAAISISGAGSESDIQHDDAFDSLNEHANHVEGLLQQALDEHLLFFQRTQIGLIIGCFVLAFVAGGIFVRVERRRRQDYLKLMQAEKRAALLLDSTAEGIYGIDLEGMCTFANSACLRIAGYEHTDEFSERNMHEIIHHSHADNSDYPLQQCRINLALREKKGVHVDNEVFWRKDGTSFPVEYWSYPVYSDGELTGAVVTFFDISERKRQERLQTAQSKVLEHIACSTSTIDNTFSKLIQIVEEQFPDALVSFVLLDKTHQYVEKVIAPKMPKEYNSAVVGEKVSMNGSPCAAASCSKKRIIVEDYTTDTAWKAVRKLASFCGVRSCWAQPIISADGRTFGTFATYHAEPRKPGENELQLIEMIAYLASIAIDRTQIEDEKNRLFAAVEHASESIAVTGVDATFEYTNPSFEKITGYQFSEVKGKFASLLRSGEHDIAFYEKMLDQVNSGTPWAGEVCIRRKDGEKRWLQRTLTPVLDQERRVINHIAVERDITDEKVINERIEHTQRLESLGVLAGGIAHDFNNILTAIMGNASLARGKLKEASPLEEYLRRIEDSSQRAADLCKQMLAYSGKGKFIVKQVSLTKLVEEITKLLEISIDKNVVMRFHLTEQLPAVDADIAQMQQVIMNLIINASEAIEGKSGVISISTGVMHADRDYLAGTYVSEALPEGRYVYLEVADTGCGMDTATRNKLFDPFFTTKFTGRGLGMSAVLGIVRGHHGTIKVYTEPGEGTNFKVLLPLSDKQKEPLVPTVVNSNDRQGSGTILIVDDEETIRETATLMLENMGFKTLCASDGDEGVEIYRKHADDIEAILLDMTMPKMDGKTTFRELRRINPAVRVVLSSGYNEQDAINRFSGQGLVGFIQKPYTPAQLEDIIHKAVESGPHDS